MQTEQILQIASKHLSELRGQNFDIFTISKPTSSLAAVNLSKVISKLSPFVSNLIEFGAVEYLNNRIEFHGYGVWKRQDPGFPDTIFVGNVSPQPGIEIKTWMPLATEITARFKDSQNFLEYDETYVCMLAWLPEQVIFGKPRILDVCIVSAMSVAKARDEHYHNPPDYIVLEPEDTTTRTVNLQQTNTNGYKWQGTEKEFEEATELVQSWWGEEGTQYLPTSGYQQMVRELFQRYSYRLDTNFAKMDRIVHTEIENFKTKILSTKQYGLTIQEWKQVLSEQSEDSMKTILEKNFDITDSNINRFHR